MIGGYWKLIDFIFVYLFLSSANIENLFYAFNWFFSDDATLIMVNLFIRSFAKIDDVKMEYSVQITFRWQEDLLFSRWPRFPGKSGPMIVWPIPTSWAKPTWKVGWRALRNINQYNILGLRSDQVLDNDRCWQGVDAGHLFQVDQSIHMFWIFPKCSISCLFGGFKLLSWQEREGGAVPQHSRAKRLHSHLSRWLRPLQHQVLDHPHHHPHNCNHHPYHPRR